MSGMESHESSRMGKDEWLTPPEIIQELGPFDLDPCSPINPPWKIADKQLTIENNGLLHTWNGFVWMNPPYGKYTSAWMQKLAMHNNGIALIFARTETDTFFRFVWPFAASILFIKGRLYFYHVTGKKANMNAGAPSVLIAYGPEADRRLRECNIKGKYIKL